MMRTLSLAVNDQPGLFKDHPEDSASLQEAKSASVALEHKINKNKSRPSLM